MKIFKILFILLIPAMGIVGCRKSDAKPCSAKAESSAPSGMVVNSNSSEETNDNSTPNYQGRGLSKADEEIYGSGDDDRDGGDKKLKKQGMTR